MQEKFKKIINELKLQYLNVALQQAGKEGETKFEIIIESAKQKKEKNKILS